MFSRHIYKTRCAYDFMRKGVVILAGIIIVILALFLLAGFKKENPVQNEPAEALNTGNVQNNASSSASIPEWKVQGAAIQGKYADAEVVDFGDKYRLYYSEEPEVSGFSGKIYSSISEDGITWTQEPGIRKEWATFASIIKLSDGKFRMYFQNAGAIKSALSSDGLSWQDEPGIRMDSSNTAGLTLENVASPTVIKIGGEYVLVYRGDIKGKYSSEVPNSNTQLFLWAVSSDGLNFEKKGIALDSRDDNLQGLADGSEFVDFNGEIRLYFWSYQGVYHAVFKEDKFSGSEFDFSTNADTNKKFYPNPPSDPTLIRIGSRWLMYYGQHTAGIYYAAF